MTVKLTPAARLLSDLLIQVFRLNGAALEAGDALAGPAGLTSARWQVMGVVDHAPMTAAEVARAMGLRRQSVQQTADALARLGLVTFSDNPSHRTAPLLTLTASGRRALREVEGRQARWADRLGRQLDPEQLRALIAGLHQVHQLCLDGVAPARAPASTERARRRRSSDAERSS